MDPFEQGREHGLRNGSVYDNPWFREQCADGRKWLDGLIAGWREGGWIKETENAEQVREAS